MYTTDYLDNEELCNVIWKSIHEKIAATLVIKYNTVEIEQKKIFSKSKTAVGKSSFFGADLRNW